MSNQPVLIDDHFITSRRGKKNSVDPRKPYSYFIEKELMAGGHVDDVAVIFLTNSECSFRCLMCDLWKNTTDIPIPEGAIPGQIEYALSRLPAVKHIKLYNSGSFFDKKAIAEREYERIAAIVSDFEKLTVECHPKLINNQITAFTKNLKPSLEIAMGLETVNEKILGRLNKKMAPDDFRRAVQFLNEKDIRSRAFILLRPPFMTEDEGILWAERSIDFAFGCGTGACTIIPVRGGNGVMEELRNEGYFTPPSIRSVERVLEYGISLKSGRVFADTWDLGLFPGCDACLAERTGRITQMNLTQKILPEVKCSCR